MSRPTLLCCLFGLVSGLFVGCVTERGVEEALEDANYCDTADECVEVFPGCPLGCWAFVNEAELDDIQKKIDRYHDQHRDNCIYDCAGHGPIRCEEGRCVADEE